MFPMRRVAHAGVVSEPVVGEERMSLTAKQQILNIARAHLAIEVDPAQQAERERRIEPLIKALSANVFRLVVMGEVKKGKSSFINSLLGQPDLSPTEIDIATSTVYKFVYGPVERITVFFLTDDDQPSTKEITRDQIPGYGTEAGNPGNAKGVDFIAVELPQPLLAEGVAIVDTPGVGGLFRRHRDITFRYAPEADVVMFVVDSAEAVISEDEKRFLKELQKHTQRIVFLQTKIDLAGTEQVLAWRKRNLEILSATLNVKPEAIPYFLVGAKLKELADKRNNTELLQQSGYPEVLRYIRLELIPKRDEIPARRRLVPASRTGTCSSSVKLVHRDRLATSSERPSISRSWPPVLGNGSSPRRSGSSIAGRPMSGRLSPGNSRTKSRASSSTRRTACKTNCRRPPANASPAFMPCASGVGRPKMSSDCATSIWAKWAQRPGPNAQLRWRSSRGSSENTFGNASDWSAASPRISPPFLRLPNIDVEPADRRPVRENSLQVVREAAMNYNVIGGVANEGGQIPRVSSAGIALPGSRFISNPLTATTPSERPLARAAMWPRRSGPRSAVTKWPGSSRPAATAIAGVLSRASGNTPATKRC